MKTRVLNLNNPKERALYLEPTDLPAILRKFQVENMLKDKDFLPLVEAFRRRTFLSAKESPNFAGLGIAKDYNTDLLELSFPAVGGNDPKRHLNWYRLTKRGNMFMKHLETKFKGIKLTQEHNQIMFEQKF